MRSHYCGQIDRARIGETLSVAGWVHGRRDHGGVIFVDLRDRSGLLQVVFDPGQKDIFGDAERLRSEFVIAVRGRVRARPAGMINPKIASGEVELVAEALEILLAEEASSARSLTVSRPQGSGATSPWALAGRLALMSARMSPGSRSSR